MKKGKYIDGVWTGTPVMQGDDCWDSKLPLWCSAEVRVSTLRYLARRCADVANADIPTMTFPSGSAANELHLTLWEAVTSLGTMSRAEKFRITASILMGLAEEGPFTSEAA